MLFVLSCDTVLYLCFLICVFIAIMDDKVVVVIERMENRKGRSCGVEFGGEGGRSVKRFLRKDAALSKFDLHIGDVVEKVFLKNFLGLFFISYCVID